MNENLSHWDEYYKSCGNTWAGYVHNIPDLPDSSRVLEAGCGNGKTLHAVCGKKTQVYAFDFSKNAIWLCRKNLQRESYADLFVSDTEYLPFSDCTFDVIFARHITGHSKKNKRANIAAEFERVLKKGGILYFSEFEVSDMRTKKGEKTEEGTYLKKNGIMTHFFTEEETKNLFCRLNQISLRTDRWQMQIRGKNHMRAEINAVFEK